MSDQRKVILYIATSVDGYIAKSDGDISFLSAMEKEGEDYGYNKFLDSVDTVILGRKTFDKVQSMGIEKPYGDRKIFILSRKSRSNSAQITYCSGNLSELIFNLKKEDGRNIYCDGGAETVYSLLASDLIDEMIISVIPVMLGEGIRLFGQIIPEKKLYLITGKVFDKGLVQLHYSCR